MIETFLISTGLVAIAEIGDKTQLLALMLAARFKRPWPIAAGILLATLLNHAAAGWIGNWLGDYVGRHIDPRWLHLAIGLGFAAMAVWALIPDRLSEDEGGIRAAGRMAGAFLTTAIAFFLAEMGDKTQIATIALAARFPSLPAVVLGTSCGLLLANLPLIFLGDRIARKLPIRYVRYGAAAAFFLLGLSVILGAYFE